MLHPMKNLFLVTTLVAVAACGGNNGNNGTPDASNLGYTGTGVTCADVDECQGANQCSPDATCANQPGTYTCACNAGFTGNGVICTDVDECTATPGICGLNGTACTNSPGGYTCT